ncbi:glucose-specific PTS transporter subunit IIBC [Tetragenococcus halophilus]|uniref:glucose-specific PTS transporter subunit IIBC n=1 Tax=Tetragenococcus halophilus TaxID=51669 RepID=UPI00209AD71A|nr:glucose-specific PTS transporter subunit IIBC [Tetragenococcus halophilus]MCO8287247.1 PTS transporter subunit EIIC [Tetragenococcus halophilus]
MKNNFMKFVNKLTSIGSSLQTPIAILPAAGILLALGTIFTNDAFLEMMPFADTPIMSNIFNVLLSTGDVIFSNLPLIFAAGVAIGLTNNDGVAALSAIVGYLIMNVAIGGVMGISPEMVEESDMYVEILGIPTIQTGVLGGIFIGVLASSIFNKFHDIQLPTALAFFAGKRSVPIITAFSSLILGIAMTFVWPPIQDGINNLSTFIVNLNPGFSGFMFGFIERLTIPFGMNHVWWPTFWLQAGEYTNAAGQIIHGDQLIFFSQLADGVPFTAGNFMNGLFVLKIFSMPAVALAMYHTAKPDQKAKVAGILTSAALTSVIAGVTEPLEFLFIFTAPALFLVYAVVTGLGFTVMNLLGAHLGLSFSGGLLDFGFFNLLTTRTNWWLLIPVGLVFAAINYFLFRYAIQKFDFKTPGRTIKTENKEENRINYDDDQITNIIKALGGKENIRNVNACYSRLRVDVSDTGIVDKDAFADQLEASGVSVLGNNVQIIYGNKAVGIKEGVLANLKGENYEMTKEVGTEPANISQAQPDRLLELTAPVTGTLISIDDVPDEVFANKMMGDGFAINPDDNVLYAPISGTVVGIFPTKHAISIIDNYGNEILLHIGLDTVNLEGEGFRILVEEGDVINQNDLIVEVNSKQIKEKGYSLITPIIFTNLDMNKYEVQLLKEGKIQAGQKGLIKISG